MGSRNPAKSRDLLIGNTKRMPSWRAPTQCAGLSPTTRASKMAPMQDGLIGFRFDHARSLVTFGKIAHRLFHPLPTGKQRRIPFKVPLTPQSQVTLFGLLTASMLQ